MTKQLGVKFIYLFCTDITAMRHFYSDLLGLDEAFYAEGEAVAYNCDDLQFTIFQRDDAPMAPDGWAWQPGWGAGSRPVMSWSVKLNEAGFRATLGRLRSASIPAFWSEPQWRGYWSYPVKDPMGNTVEVVWDVGVVPADLDWQSHVSPISKEKVY